MSTLATLSILLLLSIALSIATGAAPIENFDFFAIISNDTKGQGAFRCGASLIHPDIILTASFCSLPGDIIRLGYQNDTYSKSIRMSTIIVDHPNSGGVQNEILANDLALVKLNAPVNDIIPLGINSDRAVPTDTNEPVYVAHAGRVPDYMPPFNLGVFSLPPNPTFSTELLTGETTTVLMQGTVGCTRQHRRHAKVNRQGYKPMLNEDVQFCAPSNITSGPCDTSAWGSPMWFMAGDGATPLQAGIASQGGCSDDSPPFLYTRVSFYYDWIQLTICRLSDIKPDYCDTICSADPDGC